MPTLIATAALPTRSQLHALACAGSVKHAAFTLVGVLRLSAYVPDGGAIVGEAMRLASNSVVVATVTEACLTSQHL